MADVRINGYFIAYEDENHDEDANATYRKLINWIESIHTRIIVEGKFNNTFWSDIHDAVLNKWVFVCILEGNHDDLRLALDLKMRNEHTKRELAGAITPINYFSWTVGSLHRVQKMYVSPFFYACLLGRYSCARVMLEEYGDFFVNFNSFYARFMMTTISLPLAMEMLSLFQPEIVVRTCTAFISIREPFVPMRDEVQKDLRHACFTDVRGQNLILSILVPLYFSKPVQRNCCTWLNTREKWTSEEAYRAMKHEPVLYTPKNSPPPLSHLVQKLIVRNLGCKDNLDKFARVMKKKMPKVLINKIVDKSEIL